MCAATFAWNEDNGMATLGHGTTSTTGRAECNWKNIDDSTTAYSSSPIVAGNNSFEKWQYGYYSGTYNQISAGLWAHTATGAPAGSNMDTGLTLKGAPTMTSSATCLTFTTPSSTTNANLTQNMTTTISIGSGSAVWFTTAWGQANAAGVATVTANPAYTGYLTTQLQTTTGAGAGDCSQATMTLQYNEN